MSEKPLTYIIPFTCDIIVEDETKAATLFSYHTNIKTQQTYFLMLCFNLYLVHVRIGYQFSVMYQFNGLIRQAQKHPSNHRISKIIDSLET